MIEILKKLVGSRSLEKHFLNQKEGVFEEKKIKISFYRPFQKKYLYFDEMFNETLYQNPKIWFDKEGKAIENNTIVISGEWSKFFFCLNF